MTTINEIAKGAKIETNIGTIEIVGVSNVKNMVMVDSILNEESYTNEINDLLSFINENQAF